MANKLYIGIDIGGQSSKCGVVTENGEIIEQLVITSLQPALEEYLNDLTAAITELKHKSAAYGDIQGIGIGAPNANYYTGSIEFAPNITWCRDANGEPGVVNLAELLSERTGLPVSITNDANAAAMGEMAYGVAKGLKNFIMITLGTGVGSGIVIDGKLVYGHDGFAGELGHVCVEANGRQCNCGLKGCLETYASAMGVARTARLAMQNPESKDSLLNKFDIDKISAKDVYDAAKQGDTVAQKIFADTGYLLGRAFADFVKFSAPEAIVLFGGMTKSKEFFHNAIVSSMDEHLMKVWKGKIKILYSMLKESDAAILGASALAIK